MDDMTKITNRGPWDLTQIPEQEPELTDAQWAAREAQRALADGRYRLAASLAGLAQRAQLAEDAQAARSSYEADPATRVAYVTRDSVMSEGVRIPIVGATRDERPAAHGDHMSHAPNLCGAITSERLACVQPIGWSAGSIGFTGGAPAQPSGWYHLDPEVTDHEAFPQRNAL
jgi:hypothetical protein